MRSSRPLHSQASRYRAAPQWERGPRELESEALTWWTVGQGKLIYAQTSPRWSGKERPFSLRIQDHVGGHHLAHSPLKLETLAFWRFAHFSNVRAEGQNLVC